MSGTLQGELRQRRPFSLEQEVHLNLLRTADALERGFAELLKRADLTCTQYNVLRILHGSGSTGLACREIGKRMITRDPDITRLLDRLEKRGLISRTRDSGDRRVVTTRITAAGRKLLEPFNKPIAELHRRQLGHMTASELKALSRLLQRARKRA